MIDSKKEVSNKDSWRPCSNCKTPISLGSKYWVCSVSTCNRKRGSLVFCSVNCWDAHVPLMGHRSAWAEERWAPATKEPDLAKGTEEKPNSRRIMMGAAPKATGGRSSEFGRGDDDDALSARPPDEILIVASKVKAYIKARSGMNTSAGVMEELSDKVRALCDEAMIHAQKNERKTVLDRDFL
ncbi:hypothetical protein KAI87_08815 [Myxococcota bacterium]|nr:hypothetical protein [Myxococcota bacterium]